MVVFVGGGGGGGGDSGVDDAVVFSCVCLVKSVYTRVSQLAAIFVGRVARDWIPTRIGLTCAAPKNSDNVSCVVCSLYSYAVVGSQPRGSSGV